MGGRGSRWSPCSKTHKEGIMSLNEIRNDGIVLCANDPCQCPVGTGEKFCCEECRLSKPGENHDCFCKHETCDLTADKPDQVDMQAIT